MGAQAEAFGEEFLHHLAGLRASGFEAAGGCLDVPAIAGEPGFATLNLIFRDVVGEAEHFADGHGEDVDEGAADIHADAANVALMEADGCHLK